VFRVQLSVSLLALVAILGGAGCTCSRKTDGARPAGETTNAGPLDTAPSDTEGNVAFDVLARLDECTLGHRGVLLDLGDPSMRGRYGAKLDAPDPDSVEHEGATWARVTTRSLTATFTWTDDLRPRRDPEAPPPSPDAGPGDAPYLEARIRGAAARAVTFFLNGKIVATAALGHDETRVVRVYGGSGALVPGDNDVRLGFHASARAEDDVLAEVDWIHVGVGDPGEPYSAPTRSDALVSATIGGVSKRALSLRAPGHARCSTWIPIGSSVETSLALEGQGDADVEVRLERDRLPTVVLGSAHVTASAGAWTSVSVPLGEVGGAGLLGAIELTATRATKGTRVLLAEPRIVSPERASKPTTVPPSRGVVIVVMSGLVERSLGPYGGARAVPELALLASEGVVFESHRATTALASGSLASMLTGLAARSHTVEDTDAHLPRSLTTIADAAHQGGVSTAMFTANPTTGPAFGFDRGWDTYVAHAPTEDTPATQIFDEAARWIEAHRGERFLVVLHARGGHPPWDVSLDDLKTLPPVNYAGSFDPRHAAEILQKTKKYPVRFTEADRERAWALYAHAVEAHDAALGGLLTAIRGAGRGSDTTLLVSGDASVDDTVPVPFVDSEVLDETTLAIPLVVHPPVTAGLAGKRVRSATSSVDVAKTVLVALGLTPPASFQGDDLVAVAGREEAGAPSALVATSSTRFALRYGPLVLSGTRERENMLCDLSLETVCATDVRKTAPIALGVLHRMAFERVGPTSDAKVAREPAFLDPTTMAGLLAWGRPVERKRRGD
jgi:hypothetical protein